MDLSDALDQISEIRAHMARSEVFRGYRSLTVGFSGLAGLATAAVQAIWLPQPTAVRYTRTPTSTKRRNGLLA